MTPGDLFFLVSVLLVLILCVLIAVAALRRRWEATRRLARLLGVFVAGYAVVLIAVALAIPRRFHAPGERRCYDDWCVAAISARAAESPAEGACRAGQGSREWVAEVEISSVAKRARQRARDVRVEVEDREGRRYEACAAPLTKRQEPRRLMTDELGPGESFRVFLPFLLKAGVEPAGLVVHHGEFPGGVIIGDDQSFLHPPALLRLALGKQQ
jgi:hypothetical protein